MTEKRDLFAEIMEGIESMKRHREGKMTLPTHTLEAIPTSTVDANFIRETREQNHLSRKAFAKRLRVSPRTIEKWEQGVSKPNEQAAALILMARKYPDTFDRLAEL